MIHGVLCEGSIHILQLSDALKRLEQEGVAVFIGFLDLTDVVAVHVLLIGKLIHHLLRKRRKAGILCLQPIYLPLF